ncbi:hypothetical protein JKG68_31865 [Microvirga aerilata]|uniref:Polysaccharide chain length determinant N-terminal domain-containing protein n=1 Tax=Microvirga aerilata TaxID=670292 RepID=A0A937D178_9HYPH|nr:Wzz/FepE/Etk N-terminal domain-containing protein [Microvirga aerilata]MBL0408464.1 hypothetical protein [Microvirga aerilata]
MTPVTPMDVLSVTWKRKWTLLSVFILCNVLAWLAYPLIAPTYEATAFLIAQQDRPLRISEGNRDESIIRQDQFLNSQAQIAQSETVLRNAIQVIGTEQLYKDLASPEKSSRVPDLVPEWVRTSEAFSFLRDWSNQGETEDNSVAERSINDVDRAYLRVASAISVRVEPLTDLIRISFRHKDPQIAAQFVRQVITNFLERHAQLATSVGALNFVEKQRNRYTEEFERASEEFANFARKSGVYSIEKQREILLSRRSSILDALAATRGAIAEKEAQAQDLANQLSRLRLTNQSPQISALARDTLLRENNRREGRGTQNQSETRDTDIQVNPNDPPLLLVRVYQDTVQSLVRTNSELAGLRALSEKQQTEFTSIEQELSSLSQKVTEFDRLKQAVDVASHSSELFARKAVEQEVDAALQAQNFSKLQVAQEPIVPLKPVSPNRITFLAAGLAAGLMTSGALALLIALRASWRQSRKYLLDHPNG